MHSNSPAHPFLSLPSEPCGMLPRELVAPESVVYNFTIARRGQRAANVWQGAQVALLIEKQTDGSPRISAPPTVRTAVLRAFDAVYLAYASVTGFRPSRAENPFRGRIAIQVPLDNAGAAGLAHHDVAGISVGAGLVEPLVERWTRAVANGASWVPRGGEGSDLEALRFGDARPELASIDQVFLYELNRNFWPPWFNQKIDWMCDGDGSCWGWWTVGMNNAMTVIVPALLNMPLNYFGSGLEQFRDRMVDELAEYAQFCRSGADPFDAWTTSRMPWKPRESVNDLMTALIIRSFERFGGESWIKGFYRQIPNVPDINATAAGGTNFQGARDNLYRIFSIAAGANLYNVFVNELCWRISDDADIEIATLFPASNSLSLGLEDLSH